VLDIDIAPSSFIFVDIAQKNIKPDREETGRANESLIAAAAKIWPATFRMNLSGSSLIPQLLIPRQLDDRFLSRSLPMANAVGCSAFVKWAFVSKPFPLLER
jgi:hypothetical protein